MVILTLENMEQSWERDFRRKAIQIFHSKPIPLVLGTLGHNHHYCVTAAFFKQDGRNVHTSGH